MGALYQDRAILDYSWCAPIDAPCRERPQT